VPPREKKNQKGGDATSAKRGRHPRRKTCQMGKRKKKKPASQVQKSKKDDVYLHRFYRRKKKKGGPPRPRVGTASSWGEKSGDIMGSRKSNEKKRRLGCLSQKKKKKKNRFPRSAKRTGGTRPIGEGGGQRRSPE